MFTSASTVQCSQTEYEKETVTLTTTASAVTVTVDHTPDNGIVDQSSKSDGSQTAWMVAAIVSFVIAVSAIVLSIFLGYFLHRKRKRVEKSTIAPSNPNAIELVTKGEYEQMNEDDTRVGEGAFHNPNCIT